ncbi:Uma2 family endonuclease [Aeromicrobium sp. YIM 150415]|uniref:Uma2 family endonuclease n=1 Tax=Aeromicrobium sp. YIM 150415 TaxID=2803912 RepID=UPI0019647086|nr:Uma2 family endonuclease [Aeromicrobium sp. YIM 150415]MBM9463556.1 Uma2 family endonuclease [Aeromicrobium sp. YIM 150415]
MAVPEVLGLPRGRALTRDDLDTMPDDGHRYELIDGVLLVSPAPRPVHQRVIRKLSRIVEDHCPESEEVFFAPFDVALAADTVMQPDLLVVSRRDLTDRGVTVPPLLAVEVLSPSTRNFDLLLKKERLQRAGCAHYWVVDPDVPSVTAWTLIDGEYAEVARAAGAERFEVVEPLALSLVPSELID